MSQLATDLNGSVTRTAVRAQATWLYTNQRIEDIRNDESGEIGSWMILAAGLAAAAVAAIAVLKPWFDQKAKDITSN